MNAADLRFLFAYDRWATERVLAACEGVDETTWSAPNAIGERGLGGILVHALGAAQRWRHGLSRSPESPRPEREPLPSVAGLRSAWAFEWRALDAWLAGLTDEEVAAVEDEAPFWHYLAHVANHGTQHRSEAAVLLTAAGHSPGDLDMIDFIEAQAAAGR
ncbi:MAG TPA: DinB family protein [Candidatus Limnocylindrales bacterium]